MNICGVILAAGEGTRLKSGIPKFLHKVCGWSLLAHSIRNLKSAGLDEIYVVLGENINQAEKILGDFKIVVQKERRGTADAFLQVLKVLPHRYKEILLLYVDVPLLRPQLLRRLISIHTKDKAEMTILTMEVEDPRGYGRVIRDDKGRIIQIKEEDLLISKEKKIKEVNVGAYLFKHSEFLINCLSKIEPKGDKNERYLTQIIPFYIDKNLKITSLKLKNSEDGMGINTREQLIEANRIFYLRIAMEHIKKGVSVLAPQHTFIERDVKIGKDTVVYPFVHIESGVRIGKGCSIGPCTRLRTGSFIADNVSIGNFVEIVRSHIGRDTKIRHFSYLGDAVLGENVNIGAGTVTANYDGKSKYKTIIKDNAFIGSNTTLIAPVEVGRYAVTGAGSVVTKNKNVPDGAVVVGVPAKILRRS